MERKQNPLRRLSGLYLKLIAMVTMTIDHAAAVLRCGKWYLLMRSIGRVAFPIYCFLLVEGFFHTGNLKKYLERLLIAALVADVPFDLMSINHRWPNWGCQNVMFTLSIGILCIYVLDHRKEWIEKLTQNPVAEKLLSVLLGLAIIGGGAFLGQHLEVDYHAGGILMIIAFYLFRGNFPALCLAVSVILHHFYSPIEMYGMIGFIPILLYNGKRGACMKGKAGQWFFYLYYPLHIGVLVAIAAGMGILHCTFF